MYIISLHDDLMKEMRTELMRCTLHRMQDKQGHTEDGSTPGWLNGLSLRRIYVENDTDELSKYPSIYRAVSYLQSRFHFTGVRQIMVNQLDAGKSLLAHKDGPPSDFRFHLPVITSYPEVTWEDEIEGRLHMREGHWHGPVNYCGVMHSMRNDSEINRLHVIADFYRKDVDEF